MNAPFSLEQAREVILSAFLRHAPFDGWSSRALTAAIGDSGLDEPRARLAFEGPGDVAAAYAAMADLRMMAALADEPLEDMKIRERIARAVMLRLEQAAGEREAVRALMVFLALPGNQTLGLRLLARTVDGIWRAIGDRATDFSFYSKRAILAGVIGATVTFWLSDESEDFAETRAFLDRRIEDVMKIESLKGRARKAAGSLPDPFRLIRKLRGRDLGGA